MRAIVLLLAAITASLARAQSARDSAGIQIVTVKLPKSGGPVWKLSGSPTVEISADSDTSLLFNSVRHPRRLANGLIAFVPVTVKSWVNGDQFGFTETGGGSIALFDARGQFVRTIGTQGRGPREFSHINDFLPLADSILVFDGPWATDLKTVHISGAFGKTREIDRQGVSGSVDLLGGFSDGSVVVGTKTDYRYPEGNAFNATYFRIDHTGKQLNKVAGPLLLDRRTRAVVKWRGRGMAAVGQAFLYYAHGDKYEIKAYDRTGKLRRIIRIDREPRKTTKEDRDWCEADLERAEAVWHGKAKLKATWDDSYPDRMHAIDQLIVDRTGNLWVREGSPRNYAPGRWLVLNPEGRFLASVETPNNFEVTDIGSDYVLGIHPNEEGTISLWMFSLRR
jgi:hypothetical protein